MYQSRLVKNIEELSGWKRERFRNFVHSPYYNQHKKTTDLLNIILEELQHTPPDLDRKKVFKRLFPEKPFNEQKLYNIISYLMKLFHKFLALEYLEEQPFEEQMLTLEASYDINLFDLLKNRAKQLEKQLAKHPLHNSHYHYIQYKLCSIKGYYAGEFEDRSDSRNFQKMLDNLDAFYISEKLRHACHLTANMMVMNTQYDFHFLDELLEYLHTNWQRYETDASIALYFNILMMLREEENASYYIRLKEMLINPKSHFSPKEGRDLYRFAFNYCIRQINLGDDDFQKELFILYQQALENGYLLVNGIITEWNYKNITTLGCRLKEFQWTQNFIEEYKNNLPLHNQENAYNYNLAAFFYSKKQYTEALPLLLQVQFTDVNYHLGATFLLLKTYYELEDTEALISLLETFRLYIMRAKNMTTIQKKRYSNLVRFAKKLVLLRNVLPTYSKNTAKEKIDILRNKIKETQNIINKQWLLQECTYEKLKS